MMATPFRAAGLIAAFLVGCLAVSAPAVDQVIFKDGFSITGRHTQEQVSFDAGGTTVLLPKIRGFDMIESGPKVIIFSNKSQQVGKLLENVRGEFDFKSYQRIFLRKGRSPLPALN